MAATAIEIEALSVRAPAATDLDAFVRAAAGARVAHEPRVLFALARAYFLRGEVLVARAGGNVAGMLPILRVRGPFGTTDSSVAFLDGGGPLGSSEVRQALVREAARRSFARGATLELRSADPVDVEVPFAHVTVSREKDLLVCAVSDTDALTSRIDPRTRNKLRKALREGLSVGTEPASPARVEAFHEVYARTLRDLGSPPHSAAVFHAIARALGPRVRISLVRSPSGRVLAGAYVIDDLRERSVLPWAASDRRADSLEPNTLLYYEILTDAGRRGRRELDLGRSTRDSPAFRFKTHWGAEPRPLYWTTVRPRGARRALTGADRQGRLGLAVSAWKRLPLAVARPVGALLSRFVAS